MLETILIMVGYMATLFAGAVTNYFPTGKKIVCLIVIGIGGFFFCLYTPYLLNWIGWGSYVIGFVLVALIGKQKAKEQMMKEVFENFDEEYRHITKDANGNFKINTFKVYNGGLR
jgi:hypothetical protein